MNRTTRTYKVVSSARVPRAYSDTPDRWGRCPTAPDAHVDVEADDERAIDRSAMWSWARRLRARSWMRTSRAPDSCATMTVAGHRPRELEATITAVDRTREQAPYEAERLLIWAGSRAGPVAGAPRSPKSSSATAPCARAGPSSRPTHSHTGSTTALTPPLRAASPAHCISRLSVRAGSAGSGWSATPTASGASRRTARAKSTSPLLVAMPSPLAKRSTATLVSRRSPTRCRCCATACTASRSRRTS